LAQYTQGHLSRADIAERDVLPLPTRRLIGLTALLAMGQIEEFEKQARLACNDDVAPQQIMEMLLELADIGVRTPERVLDSLRAMAGDAV
jgi:alkylhydroperoxidase/carboxymuconolactone decarboxylase family protein YurZ